MADRATPAVGSRVLFALGCLGGHSADIMIVFR
jgi:hypothetical protein